MSSKRIFIYIGFSHFSCIFINLQLLVNFDNKTNMFRFGSSQPISGKLDAMLAEEELTLQELFNVPNIIGDIKQRVGVFVNYCKAHRQFTIKLINYGLNTSQQEIKQNDLQQISYVATEFLACDEDELCHLFLQQQTIENSSQISQHIEQINQSQPLQNISESKQHESSPIQSKQNSNFLKYQLLKQSLKILENPEKNQTCLGHIHKLFSSLIRKQSFQLLQFFSIEQQYSQLLIKNIRYDSIANILIQLVISQDKNHDYKFEKYKKTIFDQILQNMFQHLDNDDVIEGSLIFVEEVLINTKQSYYEHFEDFKRCANVLVSQPILKRFLEQIKKNDSKTFKNGAAYLQMIIRRINSDSQQFDYYENTKRKQPSMKFQHNFMYSELNQLITSINQFKKQNHLGFSLYLIFLIDLVKNQHYAPEVIKFQKIICFLFDQLLRQSTYGIVKSNLYLLCRQIIEKASLQEVQAFLREQSDKLKQTFHQLVENEQKPNNKNQNICYWKILAVVLFKKTELAEEVFFKNGIHVEKIKNKFATTLSNFHNKLGIVSPITPHSPFKNKSQLNNFFEKATEQNNKKNQFKQQSTTTANNNEESHSVGKNKISVPFLNLQDKKSPPAPIEVDLDVEKVIIEHEQVQVIALQSPKRGFSFMSMSPRGDVGVGFFKQGDKSSSRKSSQERILCNIQPIQQEKKQQTQNFMIKTKEKVQNESNDNKKISKQEVSYYMRYPVFI